MVRPGGFSRSAGNIEPGGGGRADRNSAAKATRDKRFDRAKHGYVRIDSALVHDCSKLECRAVPDRREVLILRNLSQSHDRQIHSGSFPFLFYMIYMFLSSIIIVINARD